MCVAALMPRSAPPFFIDSTTVTVFVTGCTKLSVMCRQNLGSSVHCAFIMLFQTSVNKDVKSKSTESDQQGLKVSEKAAHVQRKPLRGLQRAGELLIKPT